MPYPSLNTPSYIVLALISALGSASPYDLKQAAGERIGAFWSLAHSQLYAEPERLTKAGLLTGEQEAGGRRRKRYELTADGHRILEEWLADPATGTLALRDPGLLKLALGADPVDLAAGQLELHRATLERYEGIRESLSEEARLSGRGLVLEAGIGHTREYVRFWSELADGE